MSGSHYAPDPARDTLAGLYGLAARNEPDAPAPTRYDCRTLPERERDDRAARRNRAAS